MMVRAFFSSPHLLSAAKTGKRLIAAILFLAVAHNFCPAQNNRHPHRKDSIVFRYPMRIEPEISGSFGELRSTHFHGGMDFRTQQREGIKVYSISRGKIIGADVSKVSYGKALYVEHPNGLVSLYAHLSSFLPKVRRKIRREQRRNRSEEVRLRNLDIPVRPKRPIARSGNSGASGGPHLHLEIRQGEDRLNPACMGLSVPDRLPPELYYLAVYHPQVPADTSLSASLPEPDSCLQSCFMDAPRQDLLMYRILQETYDSLLSERASSPALPVFHPEPELSLPVFFNGQPDARADYYPAGNIPDTLWIDGPCAFGLCALDKIQDMPFHYGLYELAFLAKEQIPLDEGPSLSFYDTLAYYRLDRIPASAYGRIDLHIDNDFLKATGKRLEKGWIRPGQSETPYRKTSHDGILRPDPGSFYEIDIIARDFSGNESRINFTIGCRNIRK